MKTTLATKEGKAISGYFCQAKHFAVWEDLPLEAHLAEKREADHYRPSGEGNTAAMPATIVDHHAVLVA